MRSFGLILALAALGCSRQVTMVEIADLDGDVAFFIITNEAGRAERASETFALAEDTRLPSAILEDGERGYVLVALDLAMVQAVVPSFDRGRITELSVEIGAPPGEPTKLEPSDLIDPVVRARVPLEARLFPGAFDGDGLGAPTPVADVPAIGDVTLVIPVDPEYCRVPNQTPLTPFAAVERPLLDDRAPVSVREVRYIDDDHLLVLSLRQIWIVERGGDVVHRVDRTELDGYGGFDHFHDVTIEDGPDPREVLVVGGHQLMQSSPPGAPPTYGKLWSFSLDTNRLTVTSTAIASDQLLRGVARHRSGAAMAGGTEGRLLSRPQAGAPFTASTLDGYYTEITKILALPDDTHPFVVASRGQFHRLDRTRNAWVIEEVLQPDAVVAPERYFWFDLALDEADGRMFASGTRGGIAATESRTDPWGRLPLGRFPPRFASCASSQDESGDLLFNRAILDVEVDGDYLSMAFQRCNAIAQQRLSDGCVSFLTDETGEVPFDDKGVYALASRGNELVAVTEDGRIWVSRH